MLWKKGMQLSAEGVETKTIQYTYEVGQDMVVGHTPNSVCGQSETMAINVKTFSLL